MPDSAGREIGRPAPFRAVPCHVVHFAVISGFEPVHEMRFVLGQLDAGDADAPEAELGAPAADVIGERAVVDRAHGISIPRSSDSIVCGQAPAAIFPRYSCGNEDIAADTHLQAIRAGRR